MSTTLPDLPGLSNGLTRRVLDLFAAETLDLAEGTLTVPAETFTSDERHRADVAMMRSVPQVVAWGGEIPDPGSFTTKDVAGIEVVIIRGRDGAARAFVNACAHRGAKVASGCGEAQRLTCPYHAWSYDTDGQLVGLPGRDMFDPAELDGLGLRALPTAEVAGLIVISLDDSTSVEHALDDAVAELAPYDFGRYAHAATATLHLRANWKLVVDVNFEGYHFPYLHKNTLAPYCTNNSAHDTFGPHGRWAFPFRAIEELRGVPEEHWPERFVGTVVYFLFPSCVLIESTNSTQMLRVYPGDGPGECVVYLAEGWFGPIDDDDQMQKCLNGLEGALQVLRDEDFPAAEGCQHGVEHGLDHIVIGRNEPLLQHLHHGWEAAVR